MSDWILIEKKGKWLNQIDYAYCQFAGEQKLIEIRIIRFYKN